MNKVKSQFLKGLSGSDPIFSSPTHPTSFLPVWAQAAIAVGRAGNSCLFRNCLQGEQIGKGGAACQLVLSLKF